MKNTLGFTVLVALYDEQGTNWYRPYAPMQMPAKGKDFFQGIWQICLPTGFVNGGKHWPVLLCPCCWGPSFFMSLGQNKQSEQRWVDFGGGEQPCKIHLRSTQFAVWKISMRTVYRNAPFFLLLLSASTLENGLCPSNAFHCIPQSNLGALYLVRTTRLLHLCPRRGLVEFICYTVYSTSCPYQPQPTLSFVSQLWVEPG